MTDTLKPSPKTGVNLEHAHLLNQRVVLEAVRLYGPISRTKLARLTALTHQTAFNITAGLERTGLIRERGHESAERGQPAKVFGLNADGAFSIGLRLERDHLDAVLIDLTGAVRTVVEHTHPYAAPEKAFEDILCAIKALRRKASRKRIWGVGMALPGPIDLQRGGVSFAPHFPFLERVNFQRYLAEKTGLNVLVENDATAAAIGEGWYGVGRPFKSFFYVYIGVGLGGSLVVDGVPSRGITGNAGEIGHLVVDESNSAKGCTCGRKGCLTNYLSLAALSARVRKSGAPTVGPADLLHLFEARNGALLGWLDTAAKHLADAVENLQLLFNPQAFVVGGLLPDELLTYLYQRCVADLKARTLSRCSSPPQVLQGSLGHIAAAQGAAALPIIELISPNSEGVTEGKHLSLVEGWSD
ncbi:MAG TPA: ROK family protein [Chthoniobacterales bacterium]